MNPSKPLADKVNTLLQRFRSCQLELRAQVAGRVRIVGGVLDRYKHAIGYVEIQRALEALVEFLPLVGRHLIVVVHQARHAHVCLSDRTSRKETRTEAIVQLFLSR